jgi:subtilisin family serine protease
MATDDQIQVMVELDHTRELALMATAGQTDPSAGLDPSAVPDVDGFSVDREFAPTPLPGRAPLQRAGSMFNLNPFNLELKPEESTYIVRGVLEDEDQIDNLRSATNVREVFRDPEQQAAIVCPGDPAVGSDADVERLLCAAAMRSAGMDGFGILVAIVDSGINMAYLNSRGKSPNLDAVRSWVPRAGLTPGNLPVDHGTMCAYDVCIAAPNCTLLDIALLQSTAPGRTIMSGFLSDAVRAYRHLLDIMLAPRRPGDSRSLVVNNSWGMFHPSWDFPPSDPGNYSDNPNHPFNRIVGDLEQAGADILFAAGNCGANCPDGRCQGVTSNAIYGANSHPSVMSVAGVDTTETRVGYSSIGPGRLTTNKPDISGYTHFRGSGVYPADGGTSAATPVVTGVVAAVRSKRPYDSGNPASNPAAIRSLVTSTAKDLGTTGYDLRHGFGVVNGCELNRRLAPGPDPRC